MPNLSGLTSLAVHGCPRTRIGVPLTNNVRRLTIDAEVHTLGEHDYLPPQQRALIGHNDSAEKENANEFFNLQEWLGCG
jgi:hypothetical protein